MLTPREFPRPVAVFSSRLLFTTLEISEVIAASKRPYTHPLTGAHVKLVSFDNELKYAPFAMDHGPYNLAHTYDACLALHDFLTDERYSRRAICLYTSPCPMLKSNVALLIALYDLIVEKHQPWRAFSPLARMEIMAFRDAGGLPADYHLTIQDILWGTWKALRLDLLSFEDFSPEAYRYYEIVDNGDFNWITPHFIAFASPVDLEYVAGIHHPHATAIQPRPIALSKAFTNCLEYFAQNNVSVVVRLNDPLYDYQEFTDRGMAHVEMFFPDGSNPSDDIVREFINLAEKTVNKGKTMAVHCKAGLGRTGVLIGAYLIYKYGFTAAEVIGFMRLMRPGMVVGNQQQFMALNQVKWLQWAAVDRYKAEIEAQNSPSSTTGRQIVPSLSPPSLQPLRNDKASEQPLDAPGQPRKSPARVSVAALSTPRVTLSMAVEPPSVIRTAVMRSVTPIRTCTPPVPCSLPSTVPPSNPSSAPASLPSSPQITTTTATRRGSRPPESSPERPTKRRPSQPLQERDSPLQVPQPLPRSQSASPSLGSKLRRFAHGTVRSKTPETPKRKAAATDQALTPVSMTTGSPGLLSVGMLRGLRKKASMTILSRHQSISKHTFIVHAVSHANPHHLVHND